MAGPGHPAPAWQLVNSPFPAALRPGSALPVVLRYHADERYARVQELVITSDDPDTPVRELDVLAHTVWDEPCHDERARRCCRERRCEPARCCCEHDPDEAGHRDRAGADSAA